MNIRDRLLDEIHECRKRNYYEPKIIYIDYDTFYELYSEMAHFKTTENQNNKFYGIPYVITEQVQGFELK